MNEQLEALIRKIVREELRRIEAEQDEQVVRAHEDGMAALEWGYYGEGGDNE